MYPEGEQKSGKLPIFSARKAEKTRSSIRFRCIFRQKRFGESVGISDKCSCFYPGNMIIYCKMATMRQESIVIADDGGNPAVRRRWDHACRQQCV